MPQPTRRLFLTLAAGALVSACSPRREAVSRAEVQAGSPELRAMIDRAADQHEVPRALVHRVVKRESNYNPAARNGPYYGLMQIMPQTARTMGHAGPPSELMDPEVNLRYAVRYLRGAWMVSDGSHDRAVSWYSRGYYYEAKRRGLLRETGLRT